MTTSTSPNSINKTVFRSLLLALTLVSLVVLTHSATAQERNQGSQIIQEFQVGHNPVGLLFDGRCQPVAADHDDRVQMVRFSAVYLALGRSQLNGGHPRIIECR